MAYTSSQNFDLEIENFKKYGIYKYKFDPVGNLIFNSSSIDFSRVYLSFPLESIFYNKEKINHFYNVEFEEFIPAPITGSVVNVEEIQEQLTVLEQENITLKERLDTLAIQSENSMGESEKLASKQVIFELRKSLGEGRVDSDFSEDFPYAPIKKETR
jgi:hypothetical protein